MPPEEATGLLELPATGEVEATAQEPAVLETAEPISPETDEEEPGPETEDSEQTDPLASLDDDALAENDRVKKLIQWRMDQAADVAAQKQKHESNLAQRDAELQSSQAVTSRESLGTLVGVIRNETGDPQWLPDQPTLNALSHVVKQHDEHASKVKRDQAAEGFNAWLAEEVPDYRATPELMDAWNRAAAAPSIAGWAKAMAAIQADALRVKIRAELEAENQSTQKTEKTRAAEQARKTAPRTSGASGSPGSTRKFSTQVEADSAYERGELSNAQIREIMSQGLPYQ